MDALGNMMRDIALYVPLGVIVAGVIMVVYLLVKRGAFDRASQKTPNSEGDQIAGEESLHDKEVRDRIAVLCRKHPEWSDEQIGADKSVGLAANTVKVHRLARGIRRSKFNGEIER